MFESDTAMMITRVECHLQVGMATTKTFHKGTPTNTRKWKNTKIAGVVSVSVLVTHARMHTRAHAHIYIYILHLADAFIQSDLQ